MYKKYTQETGMPQRLYRKIWLIMRLTTIILLITLLQVSAATRAQNVTLKKTNASLKSIFTDIKKQTGYMVVAPSILINKARPVTVNLTNAPLQDAMKRILENQNLEFDIQDNSIVVREKQPAFRDNTKAALAVIDVHGRVFNEKGQPLVSATVNVKGGGMSTITNDKGEFSLNKIADDAVLQISFIGYLTKEVIANSDLSALTLEVSNSKLDEVQIQAYGTTSQRLNTGNISTLKAVDIAKQPVDNPLQALISRIPGLFIEQQTGIPGGGFNVQIRGRNSIQSGTDPLYIVDGVPYTSTLMENQGGPIFGTGSPLNYLNLGNIESIDVLKDADATAIYGNRGANGVILITTKKGKSGPLRVDVNVYTGFQKIAKDANLMNTQQYLQMRREAFKNDNLKPTTSNATDLLIWDTTRYTNWPKYFIGKTATNTNAQFTLSGGNDNTQYNIGSTYTKQTMMFPGEYSDEKKGFNFNINSQSANKKFNILMSANYLVDNNTPPYSDPTSFIFLAPNAPAIYKPDGTLNWDNFNNPVASFSNTFNQKAANLISNAILNYKIIPDLEFKTSLGYTNLRIQETTTNPVAAINPSRAPDYVRTSQFTDNTIQSWIVEPQIVFNKAINRGTLNLLLGATFQNNDNNGSILKASGYLSDELMRSLRGAPTIEAASNTPIQYRYSALFGRLNYNWENKYLVNATLRRDGSSKFGPDRRFATFGAIGLAWIFSKENFISQNFEFLSFGKLRGSYGVTGNDQIGDYQYLNLYNTWPVSYQNSTPLYIQSLFNANLEWEVNKKLEASLDLGFFKDRVLLNASYYRNRSANQLVNYELTYVTGFESVYSNLNASIQGSGLELSLNTENIMSSSFNWKTAFNISFQRNKLVSFPDLENSPYFGSYIVGEPLSLNKLIRFAGVNSQTGVYQFYDKNGAITSSPTTDDRTRIINTAPQFFGGFGNTFSYKKFELSFQFYFIKQEGFNRARIRPGGSNSTPNQSVAVLSRWQNPGDITDIQKFSASAGSAAAKAFSYLDQSDYSWGDASFIRLKNLAFSYTLPQGVDRVLHLKNARVYVQGQNLFTITKFKGLDPENRSNFNIPPLLILTTGLQVTF
jgi:TonB-linked SusC/RagA family outer membrane protein